jgi:hypothetical protein
MKFEKGDKVRVKKSAGIYGGKIYTVLNVLDDGYISVEDKIEDGMGEGWLQLILESPKLSLRLSQKDLTLKVKILHQDDSLRDAGLIAKCNGHEIYSNCYPEIELWGNNIILYIKGDEKESDNRKINYNFYSQQELDLFVSALRVMMKDDKLK